MAFFLNRSDGVKKAAQRWRAAKEKVQDYHAELWPGSPFPERQSRFAKGRASEEQRQWFQEATMTTSVFIAYMTFCIAHPRRNLQDRAWACRSLRLLLMRMIRSLGELKLQVRRLEHPNPADDQWCAAVVGANLTLETDCLWTQAMANDRISGPWSSDRRDAGKSWLTGPLDALTLPEFLAFALDPTHDKPLPDLLKPNALSLLSQVAKVLDDNLAELGRSEAVAGPHRFKRQGVAVTLQQKRAITERLWHGQDGAP